MCHYGQNQYHTIEKRVENMSIFSRARARHSNGNDEVRGEERALAWLLLCPCDPVAMMTWDYS